MDKKEVASELLKMAKVLTSASGSEISDDTVKKSLELLKDANDLLTKYGKYIKKVMNNEKELRNNWGIYGGKRGLLSEVSQKLNKLAKDMSSLE